jgi:hypothetical protein
MPLSDSHRERLDGIVQRMIDAGEDEGAIRFVVDDFQTKYGTEHTVRTPAGGSKANTPGVLAGALGAAGVAIPAVMSGARRVVEEVATHPRMGAVVGKLSAAKQLYDVASGRQSLPRAAQDLAVNEGARRIGTPLIQKIALKVAPKIGTGVAASGLLATAGAGLALNDARKFFTSHDPVPYRDRLSQREQIERAIMLRQLAAASDIDLPAQ